MDGSFFDKAKDRAAFIFAVAATTAWLVVVGAYLIRIGWAGVMGLPVGDLASLLTAAAGPPVALWLLMTVLEQRREMFELRRRMGELASATRQSVQQAETNVRATAEVQHQLKRMAAGETQRLMLQDLAARTAELGEHLGVIKGEAVDVCWARFGSGDVTAFAQPFLRLAAQHPELGAKLGDAAARDGRARSALAATVRGFDRLVAALASDKSAREVIEEGPLGQVHRFFTQAEAVIGGNESGDIESSDIENKLADLGRRLDAHTPEQP